VFVALLPFRAEATTQTLVCSPARIKFGEVVLGQSETQLITVTNTGQTSSTISAIGVSDSQFSVSSTSLPVTLGAGQSVSVNVTFTPSVAAWTGAKITFTSKPSLSIQMGGSGVTSKPLTATPSSLSFGSVTMGSRASIPVVLTNASTSKESLTAFQITGTSFSVSGPTLPLSLRAGQSIQLTVTFAPQATGVAGGNVFVTGMSLNVPLTGTGTTVGQLTLAPTALNFGSIDVGSSTTQSSTLSAIGGSVTISSAALSSAQFAIAGASFPMTLSAGQSVQMSLVFSPTKGGTSSGQLTLASNASNSPSTESLAGTGIVPQPVVNLSWNASSSSVAGYNVYRGTAPGAYSRINSGLDANTAYSDNTVATGVTYYYAATAVNSSGQESGYSTPLQVVVP
jgi:hypothetical protein